MKLKAVRYVAGALSLALFAVVCAGFPGFPPGGLQVASGAGRFVVVDLGTFGGSRGLAKAINHQGQVVGFADTRQPAAHRAFLWQRGHLQPLESLAVSLPSSDANAINDVGDVAGSSHPHAVVWKSGQSAPQPLGALGADPGSPSIAFGINNSGTVCGSSRAADGTANPHAFLWHDGQMRDLGTLPGGAVSEANAINNEGQVVGYSEVTVDGVLERHAALFNPGGIVDLGTRPGGTYSNALALNDAGVAVGLSTVDSAGDVTHAAAWQDGRIVDLGALPGHKMAMAAGINANGQAVGTSSPDPASGAFRAVLFQGGHVIDLNTMIATRFGWTLEFANGINDSGEIVGVGRHGHAEHAFLLKRR